ncbi:MAG: 5-bromo-4-chloroindolyl phosphate hydrolysis family protein [Lachnospirales bacterium]
MTFFDKLKKTFKYSFLITSIFFICYIILFTVLYGPYMGILFSLVLTFFTSIITFFVIFIMLISKKRENEKYIIEPKKELTAFEYKIKVVKSNIIKIKKSCDYINNDRLKKQVDEFILKSNRVLNICDKDNEKELNNFFEFCVPTVLELMLEYEKYEKLQINTEEAKHFKEKVISSIDEINDRVSSIEKTYIKKNTEKFDVNVKTLNTILELDGFEALTEDKE